MLASLFDIFCSCFRPCRSPYGITVIIAVLLAADSGRNHKPMSVARTFTELSVCMAVIAVLTPSSGKRVVLRPWRATWFMLGGGGVLVYEIHSHEARQECPQPSFGSWPEPHQERLSSKHDSTNTYTVGCRASHRSHSVNLTCLKCPPMNQITSPEPTTLGPGPRP